MEEISAEEMAKITARYRAFLHAQQSLSLSTTSLQGLPEISVAPFVRDQAGNYYIYVSELARHTANLLENPKAAVLFIRPESESRNPFARERIVFQCQAHEIARAAPDFTIQMDAFQAQFGETVHILRTLTDFHLFVLKPESGRYVAGFGRSFSIGLGEETLKHDRP